MSSPYVQISILNRRMKKRTISLTGYRPCYGMPVYGMNGCQVMPGLILKVKLSEPAIIQAKSARGERWGIAPMALHAGTHFIPLTLLRGQTQIMLFQLTFGEVRLGFGFRSRSPSLKHALALQPAVNIREHDLWRV